MRFLKIFLLIATVIINVHITTDIFAYATQDYCTAILANKCNNLTGCLWWSGHEGADMCQPCPEGYYCTVGTGHHIKCDQGYYCPAGTSVQAACPAGSYCPEPKSKKPCDTNCYCPEGSSASRSCPSPYLYSASGSDAKTDCHTNGGKEYSISTNTVVDCNKGRDSFGYCPTGTHMYYGRQYEDRYGWTPCTTNISGANGRTVKALTGADELTDCYVVCPNVPITNGHKQQYNQYAEATSGGKGTFPACNYKTIICNTGYEVNSSNDGCKAKTTTVSFDKNGGSGGDVSVTAAYDADMPKITPPTRTGFTFNGYYYQSIKYYDTNGNSVRKWNQTTGNITLTASWTANTYYITYDLDGGSYGTSHPTAANYDSEFTVSNPTKKNYTFASWSIEGMSDDTHYINGTKYEGTTATTATTKFKNLHSTNNASVRFIANWNEKYYEVTLNDTCPSGADKKKSVSPKTIHEKYNAGWYLTTQGGATFSQLTVLPVCNKYKFTGFCKGTCSDTNNRVIDVSGAKTKYMTNTMFSDDDTGTRQLTAHYAQCTCSTSTGAQSCSNTGTTEQNKCVFSIGCETGYSQDGKQTGSTNFAETVDVHHQFVATCQAITYGFKIDKNGGTGGTLPTDTIEIKYGAPLKKLSSYTVPCKAGYVITGLEDSKGALYYTYNASTKALAAVTDKTWDKTENPTTLYVKYDACGGEDDNTYCDCSTDKRNTKQNCPALFQSEEPADAKTDCYMTGEINLSDKFGSKKLDLNSLKLYLQQ